MTQLAIWLLIGLAVLTGFCGSVYIVWRKGILPPHRVLCALGLHDWIDLRGRRPSDLSILETRRGRLQYSVHVCTLCEQEHPAHARAVLRSERDAHAAGIAKRKTEAIYETRRLLDDE